MKIKQLDSLVIDQIAAGEVIERPASVVKELVENSLDAGADEILIEVEDGGKRLIRIRDNGCGIDAEDLPLAIISHATSKLADVTDLERIASFGFRGEALASIGAVSRLRLISRPETETSGMEIICRGGTIDGPRPVGCPPGTTIEIADLFFNTPARMKFMRRSATELGRISDLLSRLALADSRVGWTLRSGGRERFCIPRGMPDQERIAALVGKEFAAALEKVEGTLGQVSLAGYLVDPGRLAFRDARRQHLFVNGRLVKDPRIAFAVQKGLEESLLVGKKPGYVLFLSMPPDEVDVNVHPAKTEVRFRAPEQIFTLVRRAAAKIASTNDLTFHEEGASGFFKKPATPNVTAKTSSMPLGERPLFPSDLRQNGNSYQEKSQVVDPAYSPADHSSWPGEKQIDFVQVTETYLVVPWKNGMAIIDQHALHERVLYERLRQGLENDGVPVQRLLMPAVVEFDQEVKEKVLGQRNELKRLGIEVDDFGERDLAIAGIPLPLSGADPRELLAQIANSIMTGEGTRNTALEERLARAACRSAIKAGCKLNQAEVGGLIRQALETDKAGHCPHGRPTVITFTRTELEKLFKRRP